MGSVGQGERGGLELHVTLELKRRLRGFRCSGFDKVLQYDPCASCRASSDGLHLEGAGIAEQNCM